MKNSIEAKKDFPILQTQVNNKPLVYLDSAATMQKPQAVIDAVSDFYAHTNANIHRAVYTLSQQSTEQYEKARTLVQKFISAQRPEEIIFTSGTTESMNILSQMLMKNYLKKGDEIIVSIMEHHSNMLPWQQLRDEHGILLKYAPIHKNGELIVDELFDLITEKTKLIALSHASNTLGTINPIKKIIAYAHEKNILVAIDGAQAVAHMSVDVIDVDADFYAFSGHKLGGPTGIGVLYGKYSLLEKLHPTKVGGGMVEEVTRESTKFAEIPYRFEAGTPHIAGAIGLAAAIGYMQEVGLKDIHTYENELLSYATKKLQEIDGLRIIGDSNDKVAVISFVIEGLHPVDIGMILSQQGIAVRTGSHCTHPLMQFFDISGTVRASFAFYNTRDDVDVLVAGIKKAMHMLQ